MLTHFLYEFQQFGTNLFLASCHDDMLLVMYIFSVLSSIFSAKKSKKIETSFFGNLDLFLT